uniref:Uncharacterized protein n=1 Tax=Mantoniella antarctica TaxID=81844 RepID=A0A7S0SAJ0_9CHLO
MGLAVGAGICVPLAYVLQEIDRSVVEAGGVPVAYTIPTVRDLVEASGWAGADTIPRKPRDHTAEVIREFERELKPFIDRQETTTSTWRWFGWFRGGGGRHASSGPAEP